MLLEKIKKEKVVAIFRNVPFDKLLRQVDLLVENGLTIIEITLNSPSALDSISELKKRYGKEINIGAGTVMNGSDVTKVKELGAEFIISPNVDVDVIKTTKEQGLVSIPGVFTPTEVATAYKHGADILKVFPASTLGLSYVKNLKGPYPNIPLMATGGINEENANDYLESGYTALGIGSSLTSINDGDMDTFKRKIEVFTRL